MHDCHSNEKNLNPHLDILHCAYNFQNLKLPTSTPTRNCLQRFEQLIFYSSRTDQTLEQSILLDKDS